MKRLILFLMLLALASCATVRTDCVRPTAEFVKIGLEDVGDASRLEAAARKNYRIHKEWIAYAECLSR